MLTDPTATSTKTLISFPLRQTLGESVLFLLLLMFVLLFCYGCNSCYCCSSFCLTELFFDLKQFRLLEKILSTKISETKQQKFIFSPGHLLNTEKKVLNENLH